VNPLTCPYGTITEPVVSSTGQILSPGGLYTAPATIPTTGLSPSGEIVVVLISQLVGTVNAYAYVALYSHYIPVVSSNHGMGRPHRRPILV
jgi:hypothetical protein